MSATTPAMATRKAPPSEVHTVDVSLYHAGVSDKYGNVYVERVSGGFDDPDEPVALLRARDNLAMKAMVHYRTLNTQTSGVVQRQVSSVERQVARFSKWRMRNPSKTRLPGAGPQ